MGYVRAVQRSRLWFAAVCVAALGVLAAAWPAGADSTSKRDTPWARVTGPADGPAQSFGGYSAGCVQGALALPLDGPGFQVVRPSRNRHFGHPALIDFVTGLGQKVRRADLGVLLIGDLGQPRGGPAPSGHASHQSGLDVDIWFWAPRGAARKVLPVAERELLSERAVVSAREKTRTRHWSPRIARVLALAAADERVSRIFVNPVIKRELCQEAGTRAGEDRGWLRKLRPWWGHDAHFHVRLACPADSPGCEGQPELPAGDGCDEIADWLDEEKQEQRAKERAQYRERLHGMPELPAACATLLP
jgi:penicillin-insensitive murein endopeptidase